MTIAAASAGRLVVCPTPIGNLEDVTLRVLSALRDADVVACEDTRRTRVLLDRYGVKARLVSYHEHNERERAVQLVARMRAGVVVALVSDAGMPLVSDPGFVLVRACVAAGLAVEVLPGASAAVAALVASALPADRWRFVGFLPRKRAELERVFASTETLVAFESPRRVAASLAVLAALDAERPVAVCRELTKARGSRPRQCGRARGPLSSAGASRRGRARRRTRTRDRGRARAGARCAGAARRRRCEAAAGGDCGRRAHPRRREHAVQSAHEARIEVETVADRSRLHGTHVLVLSPKKARRELGLLSLYAGCGCALAEGSWRLERKRVLSIRPLKIGTPSSKHLSMTARRSNPASRASSVGVR